MPPTVTFVSKLKVQLKTAISRLRIVQAKDTAVAKQNRRQMATLIEQGRLESARIRVENIIRADLITELHELLELYCELLLARSALLDAPAEQGVDPGLEEAVRGIVFAAPRTEIRELQQARALFELRYGKDFITECMDGLGVSDRVKRKLRVEPPSEELVEEYLRAIAAAYDVAYGDQGTKDAQDDDDDDDDDDEGSGGGLKEAPLEADLGGLSPPADFGGRSPLSIAPPSPSTERPDPKIKAPAGEIRGSPSAKKTSAPAAKSNNDTLKSKPGGKIPDVDDLAARFAQLKR